ncbi:MAG: enoyl-CoA hydratase-related protein [Sphingobium sp.]
MFKTIEIEQKGAVGVLRLNDPATLNAMSMTMAQEIGPALDRLLATSRVILLTGAGRGFCSGANLSDGSQAEGEVPDFGLGLERYVNPLMLRLRDLPVPWISAVRGAAAGVGCSLALGADMVIASETAYFLQAFSRVGLVPDGGSSHMLVRSIGRVRTMEMMLLGDRLPAAKALEWGLVNQVVPDAELDSTALALGERLAKGPASLRTIRQMVWSALDEDFTNVLHRERIEQAAAGLTPDCAEGIAAFVEKRAPAFGGPGA